MLEAKVQKLLQQQICGKKEEQENKKDAMYAYKISLESSSILKISPSTKEVSTYLCDKLGSKFVLKGNYWLFSILEYNNLLKVLGQKTVDAPPHKAINMLIGKLKEKPPVTSKNKIVSTLLNREDPEHPIILHDFQIEGVISAVERGYRILIADDMGLGKTVQSIAIVKTYLLNSPTEKALIIIAETTNCKMWESISKKYLCNRVLGIKEFLDKSEKKDRFCIVIDTYRKISDTIDSLSPDRFFMGIADESQCLKNTSSQRTQKLMPFLAKIPHVILLSGTPALSRPAELYTQICIVFPNLFNYLEYHERYCRAEEKYLNAVSKRIKRYVMYTGNKNLNELKIITEALILIRRLKSGCLLLGKKERIKVTFKTELVNRDSAALRALGEKAPNQTLLAEFNISAQEKLKDVIGFVQQIRSLTDKKVIVFAFHKEVLQQIYNSFKNRAIKIDGGTTKEQRDHLCTQFREAPGIDVAVLSIKTCSTGITLVCASIIIFAELSWTPGDHLQAEDRIYRIGQKDSVKIYYLIASYFDRKLWPKIHRKISVLNKIGIADKDSMIHEELVFDPEQMLLSN